MPGSHVLQSKLTRYRPLLFLRGGEAVTLKLKHLFLCSSVPHPQNVVVMQANATQRTVHVLFLLLGLGVPVAALSLDVVENNQRVAPSFAPAAPLPASCLSRTVFGFDCPACGLTRSIIFLAHGRWADSLAVHRLGWLVFAMILMQVPYRIFRLLRIGRPIPDAARAEPWIWGTLAALLVVNRAWDLLVAL